MRFRSFRNPFTIQSQSPITDDQLMSVVPSVFAGDKHDSRSDRYSYIPTIDIVNALRAEGFEVYMACQARVRDSDRRGHARHMLRLRHNSVGQAEKVNEIIFLNSHDGTSSCQLIAGVFRFICSNGMVVGDTYSDIRVRHTGDVTGEVIEGAYEVLDSFERVDQSYSQMRDVSLTPDEQGALAKAVLTLKYDGQYAPIDSSQLLTPRRREDHSPDLWTTLNCLQENVIRGGLKGRSADGRRTTTRPVTGVDQNVRLNRALWTLAEEMQKLKGE